MPPCLAIGEVGNAAHVPKPHLGTCVAKPRGYSRERRKGGSGSGELQDESMDTEIHGWCFYVWVAQGTEARKNASLTTVINVYQLTSSRCRCQQYAN